jgi:hypothetical protein
MSRDQRPGRVKLIDTGATPGPTSPPAAATADAATPTPPDLPAPKSRTMLWSALFLIACIAGAAGVTALPLLGIG